MKETSRLLRKNEEVDFPRAMGAVDHGGFDIGGLAGAGDEGHVVGKPLRPIALVPAQQGEELLHICEDLVPMNDGDMDKEADFTILKKTDCPAVLTENMFMDTEKDCKFIMSEHGRQLITKIHVNGIIKYLKLI